MPAEWTAVVALPPCDICTVRGWPDVKARYDGKTKQGPWAHMCRAHFLTHGVGLGVGKGQELVVR